MRMRSSFVRRGMRVVIAGANSPPLPTVPWQEAQRVRKISWPAACGVPGDGGVGPGGPCAYVSTLSRTVKSKASLAAACGIRINIAPHNPRKFASFYLITDHDKSPTLRLSAHSAFRTVEK